MNNLPHNDRKLEIFSIHLSEVSTHALMSWNFGIPPRYSYSPVPKTQIFREYLFAIFRKERHASIGWLINAFGDCAIVSEISEYLLGLHVILIQKSEFLTRTFRDSFVIHACMHQVDDTHISLFWNTSSPEIFSWYFLDFSYGGWWRRKNEELKNRRREKWDTFLYVLAFLLYDIICFYIIKKNFVDFTRYSILYSYMYREM